MCCGCLHVIYTQMVLVFSIQHLLKSCRSLALSDVSQLPFSIWLPSHERFLPRGFFAVRFRNQVKCVCVCVSCDDCSYISVWRRGFSGYLSVLVIVVNEAW